MSLTNLDVAELLARAGDDADTYRRRAYRRAAMASLGWHEEASAVHARGESLSVLHSVGPRLAVRIAGWLEEPVEPPQPRATRAGYSYMARAREALARAPALPPLRGDLQMHTTASDGKAELVEMAAAAIDLGYDYIAITDHSKGLPIAGGIDEETLARQGAQIAELNRQLQAAGSDFTVLASMEVNLSVEGAVDMEPGALDSLDLALGSFHSKLRVTDDQTARYLSAIGNPHIQVIGHPQARRYDTRAGLRADWPKVFAAAADAGKAVEIDCHPHRQDLSIELATVAVEAGTYISLGTDAHSVAEIGSMDLGRATIVEAGIDPARMLNFMPLAQLREWIAGARRTRG